MNLIVSDQPIDPSIIIACAALFLSFISTMGAIYSVAGDRNHNRLSVKPMPDVILGDYEDVIEVILKNEGLGPLKILDFEVSNGKTTKDSVIDFMPDPPQVITWKDFSKNLKDRVLAPGEKKNLLILEQEDKYLRSYNPFKEEVRKALSVLTIKITYTGVYEETFKPYIRDLNWFVR